MITDHVICTNCESEQWIELGEENCPICKLSGTLAWADPVNQETQGVLMPETQTKKLIMPIHILDDHFDEFDFGIVELSQSDMERIRSMSELVKSAKETVHADIYKVVAWDYSISVMQSDHDSAELDDDRLPLKEPEYPRIDCPCLNVTDTEFFWSFYPKHTNVNCETATMSIDLLDTFDTVDGRELQSAQQSEEVSHGI